MIETVTDPLSLANLARADVRANPYALYAQIRAQDPVHWDEPLGFWTVTRYDDVAAIFHDPRFSKAEGLEAGLKRFPEPLHEAAKTVYDMFAKQILYSDPPELQRMRGLVNKAFTRGVVEGMRPHIAQVVNELLDAVAGRGQMDLIQDLAYPLPATVIMEMLGLPREERAQFKQWSDDFAGLIGMMPHSAAAVERACEAVNALTAYLNELSVERRRQPREDLLSALVAVEEQGGKLSHAELTANTVLLLVAGHETTTNLIGNGMLALLRHPEALHVLQADPALITTAIDELLRYDNPAQMAWRVPKVDVEIGGKQLKKGQFVNLMIGAANRDPAEFAEPDRLDIVGRQSRHMGFGLGPHFCLGMPLARMEGEIAFETLLRRFPNLRLATDTLEWSEHPTFRGLRSLPLAF